MTITNTAAQETTSLNGLTQLRALADSLADLLPIEIDAAATRAVADLDQMTARLWAKDALVAEARHLWRERTLAAERAAEREDWIARRNAEIEREAAEQREKAKDLYLGKYHHGSFNKKTGAAAKGCECPVCIEAVRRDGDLMSRHLSRVAQIVGLFVQDLRIEWTSELLAAGFALPDGSLTTWGDATVEQHRVRMEMLATNAVANAEAAARHAKAIETIESAGCKTLGEAVATPLANGAKRVVAEPRVPAPAGGES